MAQMLFVTRVCICWSSRDQTAGYSLSPGRRVMEVRAETHLES